MHGAKLRIIRDANTVAKCTELMTLDGEYIEVPFLKSLTHTITAGAFDEVTLKIAVESVEFIEE